MKRAVRSVAFVAENQSVGSRISRSAWISSRTLVSNAALGNISRRQVVSFGRSKWGLRDGMGTEIGMLRMLSTSTPKLTLGQTVDVAETVLMYLENGMFGQELDKIKSMEGKDTVPARLRMMLQVFLSTQLHVISPFGFDRSEKGLEDFARAQIEAMQSASPSSKLVGELQKIMKETWAVLLKRSFGIDKLPELTHDQVRYAAAKVSSNLQDPQFIKKVKDLYESELKGLVAKGDFVQAQDKLQDLLIPCYTQVAETLNGFEPNDLGYVALQTVMNQHMGDPVVAQNIQAGVLTVYGHAPINPPPPSA